MGRIEVKRIAEPDEKRAFVDKGYADVFNFEDGTVGRAVFEPGWRWSEHVKPLAGTDSCQAAHACYVVAGRMHLVTDEGEETDVGPGDLVFISPGHDAWVLGDEPCVMLDFSGMGDYARRAETVTQPSP
ncbi:MAG TPA: cupin domain-containing protein [Polyangia bacterium]|nr:cupin domain-containing protein [Polyangia bacterium]